VLRAFKLRAHDPTIESDAEAGMTALRFRNWSGFLAGLNAKPANLHAVPAEDLNFEQCKPI
jgi:hypothetical protein